MDSMSRAVDPTVVTMPSGKASTPPANASAHIIDLKSSSNSYADSPLLADVADAPDPIDQKPGMNTDVKATTTGSTKSIAVSIENASAQPPQPMEASDPEPSKSVVKKAVVGPKVGVQTENVVAKKSPAQEKNVNELNLTPTDQKADVKSSESKPARKDSKLKWVFITLGVLVALGVVAGAVILILSTTTA